MAEGGSSSSESSCEPTGVAPQFCSQEQGRLGRAHASLHMPSRDTPSLNCAGRLYDGEAAVSIRAALLGLGIMRHQTWWTLVHRENNRATVELR
jgi:hypothetical protein